MAKLVKTYGAGGESIPIIYICEFCGRTEILTPEAAFNDGWDYPPRTGEFKVVSPRTCGSCGINETAWWAVTVEHKETQDLSDRQREAIQRILSEPEVLYVDEKI